MAAHHYHGVTSKVYISGAVLLIAIIIAVVLFFAVPLSKRMGEDSIKIMTRIMGMLITAIAVTMITDGLIEIFKI